ncbi:MAG: type II toxin-antitoxin system RatA family toxin [Alphaproteobacteria bacterium]
MYHHQETRQTPYSQDQLFDLVKDIEKYPEFLPWCRALRIKSRKDGIIYADLQIGFKLYTEHFVTIVNCNPDLYEIDVQYIDGPFKSLNSKWKFKPRNDGMAGCIVDFSIDFEFKNALLDRLLGYVFNEAIAKMIHAFETRAAKIYA